MKTKTLYHILENGQDAGWTVEQGGMVVMDLFTSERKAKAALAEFIRDQHESVKAGDMSDKYNRADYSVGVFNPVAHLRTQLYYAMRQLRHNSAEKPEDKWNGSFDWRDAQVLLDTMAFYRIEFDAQF